MRAFVAGVAAALLAVGLCSMGALDWLELKTLDLRFRYANSIPESDRLVCIDIDDASLAKVGRWPWPRDEQAGLIAVLAELGAQVIVADLTWSEPQPVRLELPPNVDLLASPEELVQELPEAIAADAELRLAIQQAGNVYLAVHYDPQAWEQGAEFRAALEALRTGSARTQAGWLLDAARVAAAIEKDPQAEDSQIAATLGMDPGFVRTVFERCRQAVLRDYVPRQLSQRPGWRKQPLAEVTRTLYAGLSPRPFEEQTGLKTALLVAFRDVLSYAATVGKSDLPAAAVRQVAERPAGITPVYFAHAEAARGCGFVVFEPDPDAVMRRTAVVAVHDGHALVQLAFAAACDVLDVAPEGITVEGPRLRLRSACTQARQGAVDLVIPLDSGGRMIIPWVARTEWNRQFGGHVPADAVWTVYDRRRQIRRNERLVAETRYELFGGSLLPDNDGYRQKLTELRAAQRAALAARYQNSEDRRQAAEKAVTQLEADLAELEQGLRNGVSVASAGDDFVRRQIEQVDELAAQVARANATLRQEIDQIVAWLRPRVEGRICLLGYTATSLADTTPTPVHPRAPGIVVHANILNGLLTGRTVRFVPAAVGGLLAALSGLAASALSARLSPVRAGLACLALLSGYFAVAGGWAFYHFTCWVPVAPTAATTIAAWAAAWAYRHAFVERSQRRLAAALAQYTSPALARQMAEDQELCRRAEVRVVTAMFTDLRGFTGISERIGAERTQRVLNEYLGWCSQVLIAHQAMINKFIGDGVFAFWNPVIYPQPDHAERGCRAALELVGGLERLVDAGRTGRGDQALAELMLRIGIATGPAVVGPCGSAQKFDYTCIGDTVNVAARLESANRYFGTSILVSAETRELVRNQFLFRHLGAIQVKGRQQPVGVYELVTAAEAATTEQLERVRAFEQAVAWFQSRQWDEAAEAFSAHLRQWPADCAAEVYLLQSRRLMSQPPGEDWAGCLEVPDK